VVAACGRADHDRTTYVAATARPQYRHSTCM
jgi:hypothetical protein